MFRLIPRIEIFSTRKRILKTLKKEGKMGDIPIFKKSFKNSFFVVVELKFYFRNKGQNFNHLNMIYNEYIGISFHSILFARFGDNVKIIFLTYTSAVVIVLFSIEEQILSQLRTSREGTGCSFSKLS